MISKVLITLISICVLLLVFSFSVHADVNLWYGGDFDGSTWHDTVYAMPDSQIEIDVWFQCGADEWVADCCLPLGINKDYIDQFDSAACSYSYPFTEWGLALFWGFNDEYIPNHASFSFFGIAQYFPPSNNPWLHFETPTHVLTFVAHAVANDNFIDSTFCNALVVGYDPVQGIPNAGDTTFTSGYPIVDEYACVSFVQSIYGSIRGEAVDSMAAPITNVVVQVLGTTSSDVTDSGGNYFVEGILWGTHDVSFSHLDYEDTVVTNVVVIMGDTTILNVVMEPSGYQYLPGDMSMYYGDWPPELQGGDLTYFVNFQRMIAESVPCYLNGFWASADVNGSCVVDGADLSAVVSVFRQIISPMYCDQYPTVWPTLGDIPDTEPYSWPNCDNSPVVTGIKVIPADREK